MVITIYQERKVERAIEALEKQHFDMVITDINMGSVSGLTVLERAKALHPGAKVIVTTGNPELQYAIEALKVHGIIKGTYLATHRILRCHPWGSHGYDPVPPKPYRIIKTRKMKN